MGGEIVMHPRARVGKQHLLDERDGRGGALDIQQDRADFAQRETGMYVGPMQSGWKPLSVPLFV
jgi:hypothetical protein